eukprot:6194058-Pleurochrysis_carterae.AAC.1
MDETRCTFNRFNSFVYRASGDNKWSRYGRRWKKCPIPACCLELALFATEDGLPLPRRGGWRAIGRVYPVWACSRSAVADASALPRSAPHSSQRLSVGLLRSVHAAHDQPAA